MPMRDDTIYAMVLRSGCESLDAKRRSRTGECRILRGKRRAQAHGKLEVARIAGRDAPLVEKRPQARLGLECPKHFHNRPSNWQMIILLLMTLQRHPACHSRGELMLRADEVIQ